MRKGFTLIEVLATLVIIGIISVIAISSVNKTMENNKIDLCNAQIENIESAARLWSSDNQLYLPTDSESEEIVAIGDLINEVIDINSNYKTLVLTIDFLKNEGYIDEICENDVCHTNVYDAVRKEYIPGDTIINITKNKNKFDYNIKYSCEE